MNKLKYTKEWLEFAKSGRFGDSTELYYDKLLPEVIERFNNEYGSVLENDELLISILGYSPEPIILTARAMKPKKHIIITSGRNEDVENKLDELLEEEPTIIRLENDSFTCIYLMMKEQLILNSFSKVVVDLTGGKKSMVAAAAIFAKDYNCKIVYVDFEEYIKELRKPMPGTEILNVVYDRKRDQPELKIS
jgi:hypothetical protein